VRLLSVCAQVKPAHTLQGAAWALAHVDKYSSGVVGEVCKPLPLEEEEEEEEEWVSYVIRIQ
jgi:hypothetical protein